MKVVMVTIMKAVMMTTIMFVESMYSNNSKSYQVSVSESLAHIIPEVSIMQLKSYSRLITI